MAQYSCPKSRLYPASTNLRHDPVSCSYYPYRPDISRQFQDLVAPESAGYAAPSPAPDVPPHQASDGRIRFPPPAPILPVSLAQAEYANLDAVHHGSLAIE